jgi:hypothetical protein
VPVPEATIPYSGPPPGTVRVAPAAKDRPAAAPLADTASPPRNTAVSPAFWTMHDPVPVSPVVREDKGGRLCQR